MFKNIEYYKPNIDKTISLMTKAYEDAFRQKGGNVSMTTWFLEQPVDENLDLTTYDFDTNFEKYAEDYCRLIEKTYDARKEIDDDFIPVISPNIGIGDYSAFVAGEVHFQPDTSWSKPVLAELRGYKDLPALGSAKWYGRFLELWEALLQRAEGSGIPFSRGFFSPLDLANALRGDQLYLDYYDDPESVHELLDYCATATITFAEDLYALTRKYLGNTKYGMWYLEGNIHMSEDIACMSSPKIYREFAAPHTQRVIDHFGRGYMHTHSRAMYLVKEICSLNSVGHMWLATDPGQPRPSEHVQELIEDANGALLAIDCENYSEIEENFQDLVKGNFSIGLPVSDVQEALEMTKRFEQLRS